MLPRILYCSRTATISCTIFESYLINSLQFSEALFFTVYSPSNAFFLYKKET